MIRFSLVMRYVVVAARGFFGGHSVFSGLNYFLALTPQPVVKHPIAGPFMDAIANMGIFDLVKVIETMVGFCLLFNIFVPVALVLEMPVSVTIFWLSVIIVHSDRSLFTGSRELGLNLFLLASYAGYYFPMLRVRADQRPIWLGGAAGPVPGVSAEVR